jgi:hypothetical protein
MGMLSGVFICRLMSTREALPWKAKKNEVLAMHQAAIPTGSLL